MRPLVTAALLAVSCSAHAAESITFAGVTSATVSGEDLARTEGAISAALGRGTVVQGKDALLASAEVTAALTRARAAVAAADLAQREFRLDDAAARIDEAIAAFDDADAARVASAELAQTLELRARLAYAMGDAERMRLAFVRLASLDPDRALDPRAFPPDARSVHAEILGAARLAPPAPPDPAGLARAARRAGTRWAAGGDVRLRDGGLDIAIALASTDASTSASRSFRVASRDAIAPSVERAVDALFVELGIVRESPVAVETPLLVATPRPAATKTPARKRDRTWLAWAGAIVVAAAAGWAGIEASASRRGGGAPDPEPTPEPGVTITFPTPP